MSVPAAPKNFELCEISAKFERDTKILNSPKPHGSFPNPKQNVGAQATCQALLESRPQEETGTCAQRAHLPVKLSEAGAHCYLISCTPGLAPQLGPLRSALRSHLLPKGVPPPQPRSGSGSPGLDPSLVPSSPHPVCCRAEARFPPWETWEAPCRCLLRVTLLGCRAEGKRLLEKLCILDGDTKHTRQQIRCDPCEVSMSQ